MHVFQYSTLQPGTNITFAWTISGVAESVNCTHGSDVITNCTSPLRLPAKPVPTGGYVNVTVEYLGAKSDMYPYLHDHARGHFMRCAARF
jgi:hypothetical protein